MPASTPTNPTLERRDEQACVHIPIEVSFADWGKANALVPEVFAWIDSRGVIPAGPLFYRYLVIGDMDISGAAPFRLEIGIPVDPAVPGDDRVKAGTIPAGTYATIPHRGHPDRLEETCAALEEWASQEGVLFATEQTGDTEIWLGRYEYYLTNPEVEPNLARWETQVAYLVSNR